MSHVAMRAPLSVYLLADHLDAILAAGEDIVARGHDWRALAEKKSDPADFVVRQRAIAEEVRGLELVLVARVLKARDHARSLAEIDDRFRPVGSLFASGTALLLDAVEESGDARSEDFETGDDIVSYVRSRGLIAPDAPAVREAAQLTIDDSFLIAKRVALGPLLDMAAAFLDALDVQYTLFVEDDPLQAGQLRIEPDDIDRAPLN
ncbi:hypothetical protein DLM45_14750 [Hyphomicrobium methylovorum]|uniref:hypothetical protein n=1 Tax=Hyphomicrobium methylovorum TaxID=84 RepID=UPI0015E65BFC|nr:hypothetical protein [Hyphomicrobium methylovorum]MBA2127471.1 hypothetical protein [Hyphomicrobium methylovorum]